MNVVNRNDWVIILLFLGTFISVYGSCAFILLRRILSPADRRPEIGSAGWLVIILGLLGLVSMGYAYFIEPYMLEVSHVTLPIVGIKSQITVVQVSICTVIPSHGLKDRVAAEIENIKPDLILFTGDSVNSLAGEPTFYKFAKRILPVAHTFGVKGDWDFAVDGDVLNKAGLDVLGGSKVVDVRGNKLCIIGCDSGIGCLPTVMKAPKGMPTILLFHNPDADVVVHKETSGIDLYLCGHTHGGQIAMPGYGALITQSKQGKRFESGLHRVNNMWLYTNRGIGMEGHFPRLRFFARPELTVFKLVPG